MDKVEVRGPVIFAIAPFVARSEHSAAGDTRLVAYTAGQPCWRRVRRTVRRTGQDAHRVAPPGAPRCPPGRRLRTAAAPAPASPAYRLPRARLPGHLWQSPTRGPP